MVGILMGTTDLVATVGVDFILKGHYGADQHVPSELPSELPAVPCRDALCD